MVTEFPFSEEWQSPAMMKHLFSAVGWNQYVSNWPIALIALRHLWEIGKVSQLKSPFYESVHKPNLK